MHFHDTFKQLGKKKRTTEPPGTIQYTGVYKNVPISIEHTEYSPSTYKHSIESVFEPPESSEAIHWYNVTGLHNINLVQEMAGFLGMHIMDVEDIVHVSEWSKIERTGKYLFTIMKMIYLKDQEIIHEHITLIQKDNIVVTFQETEGDVFDEIRQRLKENMGQVRGQKSGYLYYVLMDALVDNYYNVLGNFAQRFREIESLVLDNRKESGDAIYRLRKELHYLQSAVTPMQGAISDFIKADNESLFENMDVFFSDLKEHISHIHETLETYKEMVKSLHDMYMANASNEMNKVMTTLTIFSAVFIPLSFLSGVFGMNFVNMPILEVKAGFTLFLLTCVLLAGGMLAFFKKRDWI